MPRMTNLKTFAVNGFTLLVHFAHGGLLASGIIVAGMAFAYFTGALAPYLPAKLPSAQPADVVAQVVAPVFEAAAPAPEPALQMVSAKTALRPEMRAVGNYLARRYRVSTMAIEPLVMAAQEAGSEVGLDPLLILAVTAIESRFNPFAESVVGAQGLMQVIPKYHQDKLDAHGADESGLLDPQTNIRIGARVLKESIRRMGSLKAGLQQYAGALEDGSAQYTTKVLAEKARLRQAQLQQAARRGRVNA